MVLTCCPRLGWGPVSEDPLGLPDYDSFLPHRPMLQRGGFCSNCRVYQLPTCGLEKRPLHWCRDPVGFPGLDLYPQLLLLPGSPKPHSNQAPWWHSGAPGSTSPQTLGQIVLEMSGNSSFPSALSPEKRQSFSVGKAGGIMTVCIYSSLCFLTFPPQDSSTYSVRGANLKIGSGPGAEQEILTFYWDGPPPFSCTLAFVRLKPPRWNQGL